MPLGSAIVSAGQATVNVLFMTGGTSHIISAHYSGDANNVPSISTALVQNVAAGLTATTTTLSVSSNPIFSGETVALTATLTGAQPTGLITFKDNTTVLGSAALSANNTATLNATFTTAGPHNLTASYSGDTSNTASTSAPLALNYVTATVNYYHNDIAGTPQAETDALGAVVWKESYRPYGDPMQPPAADNNIWYAGKSYETDTGLSYLGARYYDPLIGRFMGVDPVGYQEDNLHSFNRYAYGNNNPNKFVDPDGRIVQPLLIIATVLATGYAIKHFLLDKAAETMKSKFEVGSNTADAVSSQKDPDIDKKMNNNQEQDIQNYKDTVEVHKEGVDLLRSTIVKSKIDPAKDAIKETFSKNTKKMIDRVENTVESLETARGSSK